MNFIFICLLFLTNNLFAADEEKQLVEYGIANLDLSGRFSMFVPRAEIIEKELLKQHILLRKEFVKYRGASPKFINHMHKTLRQEARVKRNELLLELHEELKFLASSNLKSAQKKAAKHAYTVGSFQLARDEFMLERVYVDKLNHKFAVIDTNLELFPDKKYPIISIMNDLMCDYIFKSLDLANLEDLSDVLDRILEKNDPVVHKKSGASLSIFKIDLQARELSLSHIGNSRIIASYNSGDSFRQFTVNHTTENFDERDRLHGEAFDSIDGVFVDLMPGMRDLYVQDDFLCPKKLLKVTRCIGHGNWDKKAILNIGQYENIIKLTPDLDFIIIATNSLWEKIKPADAVQLVQQLRDKYSGVITDDIARLITLNVAQKLIKEDESQSIAMSIIFMNKKYLGR